MIWQDDRKRWLTVGADVGDLIGVQSSDRFDVRPIREVEIEADSA